MSEENTPAKKKAKTRRKKKEVKSISLVEFRAWLEGLDDALGDNWVPTKEQWKRIREKIEAIKEEEGVMNVQAPSSQPVFPPSPNVSTPFVPTVLTEPAPLPVPRSPPLGR